jgi:hypothetical protein
MDLQHTYFPRERHIMGLGCWLWSSHKLFCRWAMYGLYVYCMCCCMVCFLQTSLFLGDQIAASIWFQLYNTWSKAQEECQKYQIEHIHMTAVSRLLKDPSILSYWIHVHMTAVSILSEGSSQVWCQVPGMCTLKSSSMVPSSLISSLKNPIRWISNAVYCSYNQGYHLSLGQLVIQSTEASEF